jgi:NADH-quinone oxidoreductase subunit M
MDVQSSLVPLLILLPLAGAAITLLATPRHNPRAACTLAFLLSLLPLAVVVYMVANFPGFHPASGAAPDSQWYFNAEYNWIPRFGMKFLMGVDSISIWFILLTAILTPLTILASRHAIKERQPEFYAWMLALHAGMLGVFAAKDLLLFYLFFEFTLIPTFFLIGIWGGAERKKAAGKFFLYTFAGSVFTLAALLYLGYLHWKAYDVLSFSLADLSRLAPQIPAHLQCLLFLGLIAGLAVKAPIFPLHTWLPLSYTEAPTAGSVVLAGVLAKLGTYGMLRFVLPILPEATRYFAPAIAVLCIIGILYGALVAWAQTDLKKLIAYSSLSHLGFCVLGLFALTREGLTGAVLYMLNHGVSTGALFLIVGMIGERYRTRDLHQIGGLVRKMPALGFFAVFFVLSSIALPGFNGFVSEFLVLLGTFVSGHAAAGQALYGNLGPGYAIPAAVGVILGAVYMLYWTGRLFFGPLKEPVPDAHSGEVHAAAKDLSLREWLVLTPLAVAVLVMGVYPQPVISSLQPAVDQVADAVRIDTPTVHFVAAPLPERTAMAAVR